MVVVEMVVVVVVVVVVEVVLVVGSGWLSSIDNKVTFPWEAAWRSKGCLPSRAAGPPPLREETMEGHQPDAVAKGLPAGAQGLREDGALAEEEVEGGFMEGLLTVTAGLMTGGHSAHAAGCR